MQETLWNVKKDKCRAQWKLKHESTYIYGIPRQVFLRDLEHVLSEYF